MIVEQVKWTLAGAGTIMRARIDRSIRVYDLTFHTSTGEQKSLREYRGRVLLIVNTATKCGLAPQFEELEKLHQEYKDKGLVVIGFPCNQFADQEPETNETMVATCKLNFGVTFMLTEKIDVNGPDAHPLFTYLKGNSRATLGKEIKWNFTKFLVSRDGGTIRRFAPTTTPEKLRPAIEKFLAA